ncbi:PulJ/GspJ family protein [Bradyrhizobium sp. HKCCYLS2038]|uniref:PulJ/GspJ family protein n=1 Tax=unclassified Bradyrhizobium TaxID=2631580 RepID=UPI003EBF2D00
MRTGGAVARPGEQGFTLIEALASLALTGLVLSALATLTAQWLPSWNRGFDRIQQSELIGISMRRIAADLAAAEFVAAGRTSPKPLFEGTALAVTFVRAALGPNAGTGLDVVRFGEIMDQGRLVTARMRVPFVPLAAGAEAGRIRVADPVVLLRPPFSLSFAYAGPDHVFHDEWRDMDALPTAIRLTVRDAASQRALAASTVTRVHVEAPARGGTADDDGNGAQKDAAGADNAAGGTRSERRR